MKRGAGRPRPCLRGGGGGPSARPHKAIPAPPLPAGALRWARPVPLPPLPRRLFLLLLRGRRHGAPDYLAEGSRRNRIRHGRAEESARGEAVARPGSSVAAVPHRGRGGLQCGRFAAAGRAMSAGLVGRPAGHIGATRLAALGAALCPRSYYCCSYRCAAALRCVTAASGLRECRAERRALPPGPSRKQPSDLGAHPAASEPMGEPRRRWPNASDPIACERWKWTKRLGAQGRPNGKRLPPP